MIKKLEFSYYLLTAGEKWFHASLIGINAKWTQTYPTEARDSFVDSVVYTST